MSLFRTSDVLLVLLMVGAAALTYKVKHDSQKYYAEIRQIERQIEAEKSTFTLLKADWARLSNPARIKRLVEDYHDVLDLDVMGSRQIVSLGDVPEKLPDAIDVLIAESETWMVDDEGFETIDSLITASVEP